MTRAALASLSLLAVAAALMVTAPWAANAGARGGVGPVASAKPARPALPGPQAEADPAASGPVVAALEGTTGALRRQPLSPAAAIPRGPRLFERCNREAVARRYRGAERRHFVRRCQLGYGRRLFRRRNVPAGRN